MRRGSIPVLVLLVSGCAAPLGPGSPPPSATSQPSVVAVEPTPSATPAIELPPGRIVPADSVMFSADMSTVMLTFVGGREWSAEAPECTADYAGWARDTGDALEVAVVNTVAMRPGGFTPEGHLIECDLVGFTRWVVVELPEPFIGSAVRDVDGPALPIMPDAAADLYEIPSSALADGWVRQVTVDLRAAVPPFPNFSTYAPGELTRRGDPRVLMIQYFEAVAGQGPQGSGTVTELEIAGSVAFLVEQEDCDLILNWNSPTGSPITLVTNVSAISAADLIQIATSVRLPDNR